MKVAYTSPSSTPECVRVQFVSYPVEQVDAALVDVSKNLSELNCTDGTIYTCGISCNKLAPKIQDALGLSVSNGMEMDKQAEGLRFLTKHFPMEAIAHPESQEAKQFADKTMAEMRIVDQMFASSDQCLSFRFAGEEYDTGTQYESTPSSSNPTFPVLLCTLGSGAFSMKVDEDKFCCNADLFGIGARSFMGLGFALTKAETFPDFLNLVHKGDSQNVDILGKHMKVSKDRDLYAAVQDDTIMIPFGHVAASPSDTFRPEDLAAAWMRMACHNFAQCLHLSAMVHGTRTNFVAGSLPEASPLIRVSLEKYLLFFNQFHPVGRKLKPKFYFLKYGGYLGALGALLSSLCHKDKN